MAKRVRDLDDELDKLRLQTRVCQFCRAYGRTWYKDREVFKYGVRHYAHPWCIARAKVAEEAVKLIAEHERADFWAKLEACRKKVAELVRERFEEWTKANDGEPAVLMEEELLDQLEDRLPGLDEQEIYSTLHALGAVAAEASGPAYDNETVMVYRLPAESKQVKFTQTSVDGKAAVTMTFERDGNELKVENVQVHKRAVGHAVPVAGVEVDKIEQLRWDGKSVAISAPTAIRIYPAGRRRHDLANAIVAAVSKGKPVVVIGTAEQERDLKRRMKKILDNHPEYASVMYERKTV